MVAGTGEGLQGEVGAADAWLIVSGTGVIEKASPAALAFLYIDAIDAIGRALSAFVVPAKRGALAEALGRAHSSAATVVPMRLRPKGRSPRSRRLSVRVVLEGRLEVVLSNAEAPRRRPSPPCLEPRQQDADVRE